MIQAITCAFVPTSGAGISLSGPIRMLTRRYTSEISRSSSLSDSSVDVRRMFFA